MSEFIPHKDDLATNAKLPGMVTEDMRAIEAHDADDHETFNQEVQDRKDADKDFQDQIDKVNDRLDKLDSEKASKKHVHRTFEALSQLIQQYHDDIVKIANDNEQKMNDKAERVALGTDMDTVRQVVMLILQEQGIVPATTEIPKIKDPDKAASAAGEVAAASSGEDSRAQAASAALAELNLPKE